MLNHQLATFIQVAENGSFSEAAREALTSRPAP